ncbi:MAG: PAS domain-containing protein [Bryobacterales bacterium]|nr:PAS domain-containing protein [Bryobacterales bacterium]
MSAWTASLVCAWAAADYQDGPPALLAGAVRRANWLLLGLAAVGLILVISAVILARLWTDLARRRRIEQELRKSQAGLAHAQRMASLGDWQVDFQSGAAEWSDEAYRIFGVEPGSVTPGRERFLAFVHPDDREQVAATVNRAHIDCRPYSMDHRIVRPSGEQRYVRSHAEPILDPSGAPVGMAGIVQDITEYKRLEEELREAQKLESVGRLAGGVAHDFNNLLTIINGYSELILSSLEQNDPRYAQASEIRKAGERAAALTRHLLAVGQKQMIRPKLLDLNAVIRDFVRNLPGLWGPQTQVSIALDPALGRIRADDGQIHHVLLNLTLNARDAMPHGGTLRMETANFDLAAAPEGQGERVPGSYVRLTVSDTGVGMDERTRAHLFEPFFTTKEPGSGAGLGLATVYGIVRQNHGWIETESAPGKGTTFRICLPRVPAGEAETPAEEPARLPPGGPRTVLLVEDEPELRKLAAGVLRGMGFEVLETAVPAEALALCESRPGALLLMVADLTLPGMSGTELAGRAAGLRPGMRVLFISGYSAEAPGPGQAFLPKPFTPEALAAKVREILGIPPEPQ